MGRLESLSAWALGRGHYEEEVIQDIDPASRQTSQQYNSRGYPRNPRTKRREKDNVRAANEVMQTTGVVEDAEAAKAKLVKMQLEKSQETLTALRLMEGGRAALIGGVWGVLGLRRRILLYRPYAEMSLLSILKQEGSSQSMSGLMWSGLPTVVAYHVSDWVAFLIETILDALIDEEESDVSPQVTFAKIAAQKCLDIGFCYITLHFRLFAILQQLGLIPSSRLIPSLKSFIPFSQASPLHFPPTPSMKWRSIFGFASALLHTAAPLLIILAHGKIKYFVSRLVYRPIYKSLPRPTGESMFTGLAIAAPTMEYDTPDRPVDTGEAPRSEDSPTLRALEGLPGPGPPPSPPTREPEHVAGSDDEEEEETPTTLISFDVEATEPVETAHGTWSAELRSAQEPVVSVGINYRTTGLTMLPTIMATEGLREVIAGMLVMPLEALMVRIIGRAYRTSAGLEVTDMYGMDLGLRLGLQGFENVFSVLSAQVAITGMVWAGFIVGSQWYAGTQGADQQSPRKGTNH